MQCVFLGVQLVIDRDSDRAALCNRVRSLVRESKRSQRSAENAALHRNVIDAMLPLVEIARSAYWDFILDATRADEEFTDWCSDIEWAQSFTGGESANPFRSIGSGEYIVVTVCYMILGSSGAALNAGAACDIAESAFWRRETLKTVLTAARDLDFGAVQSDAVYIVPGASDQGVPTMVIDSDGFNYLRPLEPAIGASK